MYETQISAMHPPHRREGSDAANIDIASNRDNFLLDPARIVRSWSSTRRQDVLSQEPPGHHAILAEIRATIFAKDVTLENLVDLMGGSKAHVVNFSYLARKAGDGPATLEFRQHEGCLYGPSVKWWVLS
jgi:hypothetical protein